jgi:hypothetical protein
MMLQTPQIDSFLIWTMLAQKAVNSATDQDAIMATLTHEPSNDDLLMRALDELSTQLAIAHAERHEVGHPHPSFSSRCFPRGAFLADSPSQELF